MKVIPAHELKQIKTFEDKTHFLIGLQNKLCLQNLKRINGTKFSRHRLILQRPSEKIKKEKPKNMVHFLGKLVVTIPINAAHTSK